MDNALTITNRIWRGWMEQKIKPSMTWVELRKTVEDYVKKGLDPYSIGVEEVEPTRVRKTPLEALKEANERNRIFKVKFYFETEQERRRVKELLARHDFYFSEGPEISLVDIDQPDHILELLASEGFDTSNIMVERRESKRI